MSRLPTRCNRAESAAEIICHMADALAYLYRVARDANLDEVSADLVLVRQRLLRSGSTAHEPPETLVPKIEPRRIRLDR